MYLISEYIFVVLGVLAVAVAMVLALQPRRTPQASFAWILFIILAPYVAVPLFLLLGFRKSKRAFPVLHFAPDPAAAPQDPPALAHYFQKLGAADVVTGNHIELHTTPEAAQRALSAVIASAQHRLEAELYIVAKDNSGRDFLRLLTEKCKAGVAVRLSIDWLGSLKRPWPELNAFTEAGGELRFFSPIGHLSDASYLNLRNHRKLVVADGIQVWTGGRNVGDEYLASPEGKWKDLSCTLKGPIVQKFNEIFAADWQAAGGAAAHPPQIEQSAQGTAMLQLAAGGPDEAEDVFHNCVVNAIHRANRRIWLATPYFVPSDALLLALATAAQAGVDVRLYVPHKSNQWTTDLARGAYLRSLKARGVQIYRYMPGMMHAKVGAIDDMAWLGSANFDIRSMFLNFELAIFAYDGDSVQALETWFEELHRHCDEGLPQTSVGKRFIEGIFRLSSPIL